ncbi:MAG: VOC family protein [Bacteroidota bacterium]
MNNKWIKSPLFHIAWILLLGGIYVFYKVNARLNPGPSITDSPTTIIGINHVGISVKDLDKMVAFYQQATNYPLLERTHIASDEAADRLFGQAGIQYEKAILKGPNMLLELTEFSNQTDTLIRNMPPQGPGMTHTCYQSADANSGYDMFKQAGVSMLSRGDEPVDLGGYGVTYAYAYDPEGNMVELEQMSETLIKLKIGTEWAKQHPVWMTQVALISPDLPQLTAYYQTLLAIEPFRVGSFKDNPKFDEIGNLDNLAFDAAWFGMDTQGKKIELMQYVNPPTPRPTKRKATDLGYTFSLEVLDIQEEYNRLKKLGVDFLSEPQKLEEFWTVLAHDVDGNLFSLRQAIEKESRYSLRNF